jgi:hypothetical protein
LTRRAEVGRRTREQLAEISGALGRAQHLKNGRDLPFPATRPLICPEEENLVLLNRPSEGPAEGIAFEWRPSRKEEVFRIQNVVPKVFKDISVK